MTNKENIHEIIERAKQQLERMIDLAPQAMLLLDSGDVIRRVNRTFLELLGLSDFNAVLGKRISDVFPGESRDIVRHEQNAEDALPCAPAGERECSRTWETETRMSDGRVRLLRFSIMGSGGEAGLSVAMAHDVTRHREWLAHLAKEHKKEAVVEIVGALMHNINQPLTVISIRAGLAEAALANVDVPDEVRENIREISGLAMQIAGMLEQIQTPKDYLTEDYPGGKKILAFPTA